ncbi:asparagine synthase-related protein, partial [Klebsiella pneumoniae]|nr:asparagine synthase-related protein [Klebsiella pneumoniae]
LDNEYVRYMCEAYNFRHKNVIITQEDTAGLLKEALFARDYPGMADIDSSMLYLCKSVVLNHKVVLTGECADE